MLRFSHAVLFLSLLFFAPDSVRAEEATPPVGAFQARLAQLSRDAKSPVVAGKDGWLFFAPELRSISAGEFWGEKAAKVSRASNPKYADPLPAIVSFHEELKAAGIELLLVPVPAKVAVYPESISQDLRPDTQGVLPRGDAWQSAFHQVLRKRGVAVLDLCSEFVKHRNDKDGPAFCRTDTHWSGRGTVLAARAIAAEIRGRSWMKDIPRRKFAREPVLKDITGDLAKLLDEKSPVPETVLLDKVLEHTTAGPKPVDDWRESPILLLGDSHTLVFHDADLHGPGAGLPDQLALELGFPVDLIGVRGSGATAARISLLRRGDQLAGKKLVIWCFASREFTESTDGWRVLPILKKR